MGKKTLKDLEKKGKITTRDMLIAMVLAGNGEYNSEERIEEEAKILNLIKTVDGYLKEKKG